MSIGYWILIGVGIFSFIMIMSALWPALGEFLAEVISEVLGNLGDD